MDNDLNSIPSWSSRVILYEVAQQYHAKLTIIMIFSDTLFKRALIHVLFMVFLIAYTYS